MLPSHKRIIHISRQKAIQILKFIFFRSHLIITRQIILFFIFHKISICGEGILRIAGGGFWEDLLEELMGVVVVGGRGHQGLEVV